MLSKPSQPSSSEPLAAPPNSKTAVSINQRPVDLLPHEQDQSTSNQISPPRKIMKQAASDVGHGLKDTDRGVEADKTYAKQKLP